MTNDQERSDPARAHAPTNRPGKNPNRAQPGHHRPPAAHLDQSTGQRRHRRWPVGAWALAATAVRVVVELVIGRT